MSLLQSTLERASAAHGVFPPGSPRAPRSTTSAASDSDDDETISVQTAPGTPIASRSASRSTSPTRLSSRKRRDGTVKEDKATSTDPLKRFPNDVSSKVFSLLDLHDLITCKRVCQRWKKSQTLSAPLSFTQRADLGLIWSVTSRLVLVRFVPKDVLHRRHQLR